MRVGASETRRWVTPLRLATIGLLLACGVLLPSTARAGEPPTVASSRPSQASADPDDVRGLLVFRVSAGFIRNELERDIHRCSPVDRTIEGTRNIGTAETVAKMTVELDRHEAGIAFRIVGRGVVNSNTTGRNGPAIIRSNLRTPFTAYIPVLFDGAGFRRGDVELHTDSRLYILSIDSEMPGLRGRLVTRIATRRAAERLPRVRAITTGLTEQELRESIAESLDQAIARLNERLQTRRLLSFSMRIAAGRWLRYSSSPESLRIAWYPLFDGLEVPRCPVEGGGDAAVQLWVHKRLADALGIAELPKITDDFESWLQMLVPGVNLRDNVPIPVAVPLPPIRMHQLDEWYVVQYEPP